MRSTVGLGLVVLFTVGCADRTNDAPVPVDSASPSTAAAPVARGSTISGTVLEQIPVSPYVYLRVETANGALWTAVPEAPFAVGSPVTIYNALPMEQFESTTLKRTFDRLYFGSLEPVSLPEHGASAAPTTMPQSVDVQVGPIEPATGNNSRTINALWLQMDKLVGTSVTVRGVVVKYNDGMLGKNWIHLQDGSGDQTIGTHDITVTSLDVAAIGDTVTVTGVLRTKVDVGAGYTYPLLLEDARVVGR